MVDDKRMIRGIVELPTDVPRYEKKRPEDVYVGIFTTQEFRHYFVFFSKKRISTDFLERRELLSTKFPGILRIEVIKQREGFNIRDEHPTSVYWDSHRLQYQEQSMPREFMPWEKLADLSMNFTFGLETPRLEREVFVQFYLDNIDLHPHSRL